MATWGVAFAFGMFFGFFLNWIFFKLVPSEDEKRLRKKQVLGGRRS